MTQPKENMDIEFEVIDNDSQLKTLTDKIADAHAVALDTEADSFHHYRPRVCLIQISFDGQTFIIDPLAPIKIKPFLHELAQKELIIHDAGYDLRMLSGDFGFKPKNAVFDTMLGASLAGLKNVGLSGLLGDLLDMKVAKHNQKADWSKRPLTPHLLKYAAEDTAFLMQIKTHLAEKLKALGRADWHAESCQAAVAAAYTTREPADPDNEWRIKGTGTLSFKDMAFVRELWYWRENIAKETNRAAFMIFRNEEIIKLAQWAAKRKKAIDAKSKLPIRHKTNKRQNLIKALQKAQALKPDQWPGPRKSDPSKRLSNSTRNIVNKLKAECEIIAHELDLPLNLIASRAALTRIVTGGIATREQILKKKILLNWQSNLILPAIEKVLSEQS